ncbi:hypothetical protein [Streptomyces collinus]|uniref:hypothetical protein n=1 Tax=Streptomyces collinus TaxID=42684 RepID=UPI0037B95B22
MSNGWNWIEEGQRIAEQNRQAQAGALDLDAVKAESIVFESPLDSLKAVLVEPPTRQSSFVDEVHALKNEVDICRAGHCTSGYKAVELGDRVKRLETALREALALLGEGV